MSTEVKHESAGGKSEPSAIDCLIAAFNELEISSSQPDLSLEECFGRSKSLLKSHMKYLAMQVYRRLLATPEHPSLEWFEAVLTLSETICSIEGSENRMPLRQVRKEDKTQLQSLELPQSLKSERAEYELIMATVAEWDRDEQVYRASVLFLQGEHRIPRYFLDVEQEAIKLYEQRLSQLECIVDILRQWQNEGIKASYADYYQKYEHELDQLRPRRLLDRILSGVPAKADELVTDIDVIRLPRDQWPQRRKIGAPKQFILTTARIDELANHVKDTHVESLCQRWKKYAKQHKFQMLELAGQAEYLQSRGELQYRIQLRQEKRMSQLQEEESMIAHWLAQGFLDPQYGARLVDLQHEILANTPEKLYERVVNMSVLGTARPRGSVYGRFSPDVTI